MGGHGGQRADTAGRLVALAALRLLHPGYRRQVKIGRDNRGESNGQYLTILCLAAHVTFMVPDRRHKISSGLSLVWKLLQNPIA